MHVYQTTPVEWTDLGRRLTLTLKHVLALELYMVVTLKNYIVDLEGRTIWLTLKEDDAIAKGCGNPPEERRTGLGGGPRPELWPKDGAPHLTPSFLLPGFSRILYLLRHLPSRSTIWFFHMTNHIVFFQGHYHMRFQSQPHGSRSKSRSTTGPSRPILLTPYVLTLQEL